MGDTTILILAFTDLIAGFFVWLYLKDYFNQFKWWQAALIKSCVYPLFLGIGAFGEGGGDPGFMLPAPILPAAVVSLSENKFYVFVQNALLPYIFWTSALFAFYCLRQVFRHLKETRQAKTIK
jgi:hypothetical protein